MRTVIAAIGPAWPGQNRCTNTNFTRPIAESLNPNNCTLVHLSKDWYLVPRRLREVVVDGEEDHEAEEEAARGEKVPDVVVVVEVEQPTSTVR